MRGSLLERRRKSCFLPTAVVGGTGFDNEHGGMALPAKLCTAVQFYFARGFYTPGYFAVNIYRFCKNAAGKGYGDAAVYMQGAYAHLAVNLRICTDTQPPRAAERAVAPAVKIHIVAHDGQLRKHGICLQGYVAEGAHGEAGRVGFELYICHAQVGMAMYTVGRECRGGHPGAAAALIAHHLFGGYFRARLAGIK